LYLTSVMVAMAEKSKSPLPYWVPRRWVPSPAMPEIFKCQIAKKNQKSHFSQSNNNESDAVVWREHESRDENQVMEFPIKKRNNTELLNDKMVALYIVNGRIKNMVRVVNHWHWWLLIHRLSVIKMQQWETRGSLFIKMTLKGM